MSCIDKSVAHPKVHNLIASRSHWLKKRRNRGFFIFTRRVRCCSNFSSFCVLATAGCSLVGDLRQTLTLKPFSEEDNVTDLSLSTQRYLILCCERHVVRQQTISAYSFISCFSFRELKLLREGLNSNWKRHSTICTA